MLIYVFDRKTTHFHQFFIVYRTRIHILPRLGTKQWHKLDGIKISKWGKQSKYRVTQCWARLLEQNNVFKRCPRVWIFSSLQRKYLGHWLNIQNQMYQYKWSYFVKLLIRHKIKARRGVSHRFVMETALEVIDISLPSTFHLCSNSVAIFNRTIINQVDNICSAPMFQFQ